MTDYKITLTHINIRQSIAILLAKLIFIDIAGATVVILFYFTLMQSESIVPSISENTVLFLSVFLFIGVCKLFLDVYVVLKWLNEYYEITPEHVIHKRGVIFSKTEQYAFDKVRLMDVQDTFIGELFNFATITLYDIRLHKYLDLYLIHNPQRYVNIIKTIRPDIEIRKDRVRLPFMPKREEDIQENDDRE